MSWRIPGLLGTPYTVDCHAHMTPPRWAEVVPTSRRPNLDALFRQQDAAGISVTVFGEPGFSRPPDRAPVELSRSTTTGPRRSRRGTPTACWAWPRSIPSAATRSCASWSARCSSSACAA
jgi:hypothetical protein